MSAPVRIELPAGLLLVKGEGDRNNGTACLMTAVAWIAGESHRDFPECACPIIRRIAIRLNDSNWWASDAERTAELLPLAHRIVGTRSTREIEAKRVRIAVLRAARVFAPLALDAIGQQEHATTLRALADDAPYETIRVACKSAANAAYAAAAANAANAAYAAAAAAYDAAYAAYDAAYAAYDAAYAAAAANAANAANAAYAAYDAAYAYAAANAAYAAAAANAAYAKRKLRDELKQLVVDLCEVTS